MAYGLKQCAACGRQKGLHLHHLRPQVHGGKEAPTVWLCGPCHSEVHSQPFDVDHSALIKAGLAKAKERGILPGRADFRFTKPDLAAAIVDVRRSMPRASQAELGAALAARGYVTASGKPYSQTQISRFMARL